LDLNDRVAKATTNVELDEAEKELDIVLRQVLIGLKYGNVSTRGLDGSVWHMITRIPRS
jgi:hypothetical protein